MSSSKTNPATLAACGAREIDQKLAGSIVPEITPPAIVFQARRLSLRFGFSPELASVLAEIAFQTTRRRA